MSSGSACWILWLTPMDWLALSIGRSGSQPLEYSLQENERRMIVMKNNLSLIILLIFIILSCLIISLRIWFRIKEVNKQKNH